MGAAFAACTIVSVNCTGFMHKTIYNLVRPVLASILGSPQNVSKVCSDLLFLATKYLPSEILPLLFFGHDETLTVTVCYNPADSFLLANNCQGKTIL